MLIGDGAWSLCTHLPQTDMHLIPANYCQTILHPKPLTFPRLNPSLSEAIHAQI